ncbi:MAG: hypothetical protein LBG89_01600 [Rickettsiales bacterium]|jgi:ABC-type multidrug transport system fused ATPase/permease subunit|nr:hypothetical protein [Rickettsiales bacterium]
MNNQFHKTLNRMVLFTALIVAIIILFWDDFLNIAMVNIWLNGAILGAAAFGTFTCFLDVFRLVPEYRWMKNFFYARPGAAVPQLPPFVLRPVAKMLTAVRVQHKPYISSQTLNAFLDIIMGRFEDTREQNRYTTNILVFLGLLGTFWGLLHTIGAFGMLVDGMDFGTDFAAATEAMRSGLTAPLAGMGTAFSSSFLGLAGSLMVGFLALQTTLAQNAIFRELEENLSNYTKLFGYLSQPESGEETILPYVQTAAFELSRSTDKMTKSVNELSKHIRERDKQMNAAIGRLSIAIDSVKEFKKEERDNAKTARAG